MSSSLSLDPPRQSFAAPRVEPTLTSVAFILNDWERRTFFGASAPVALPGARCRVFTPEEASQAFTDDGPTALVTGWSTPSLSSEILAHTRYICHVTGSVRNVVPRAFLARGGFVSNWGELIADDVAEHALLLILASLRNLPRWASVCEHNTHDTRWALGARPLGGLRVGLHGFGLIARRLAQLLRPFNVHLSAYTTGMDDTYFHHAGVALAASLDELFATSDILVECEALNDATRHSVDAKRLRLLRDDAVFINIGRAAVVDEPALLAEAHSGRLRIGLDVFAHEPLAANSPWLGRANVVASPHIGGPTQPRYRLCGQRALDNLRAFLCGEKITGLVSLEAYDRST